MEQELEKLTVKQLSGILSEADIKIKSRKKADIISEIIKQKLEGNASELIELANSKPKGRKRAKKAEPDGETVEVKQKKTRAKPKASKPEAEQNDVIKQKKPRKSKKDPSIDLYKQVLTEIFITMWDEEETQNMWKDRLESFKDKLSDDKLKDIDYEAFSKYTRDLIVSKLK